MWELEVTLARDAINGCSIAEQLSPKALRDWVLAQPELEGNVKLPTTIIQYIDDCSGCALGKYRAIAGLVFTWSEMDKVNMQYGVRDGYSVKAQLGESTELLGIDSHWGRGLAQVSAKKTYILNRWIQRVLGRNWITQREMDKLWGTIGNVSGLIEQARCFMSFGYRAKTSTGFVRSSKHGQIVVVASWLKDSLRNLLQRLQEHQGSPFSKRIEDVLNSHDLINTTDAARTISELQFSGLGGVLLWEDTALVWFYRLDMVELEQLEIQVTEMWANLTGTALIPWFKSKVHTTLGREMKVKSIRERIDNMGAVFSIKGQRTKDIRNEAMLALRLSINAKFKMVVNTD